MKGNVLLLYPLFIFVYLLITIQFFKHPESDEIAKITNTFISDMKKAEEYAKTTALAFAECLIQVATVQKMLLRNFENGKKRFLPSKEFPKKYTRNA